MRVLAPPDFELLQPHIGHAHIPVKCVLAEPNRPSTHIYFVENGLASEVVVPAEHRRIEVEIYGREGVGPASIVAAVDRSPHQHVMPVGDNGHRVDVETFATALQQSADVHDLFLRNMQVVLIQTSYAALSNGSGLIGERLARWLLMCQDRLGETDLLSPTSFWHVLDRAP